MGWDGGGEVAMQPTAAGLYASFAESAEEATDSSAAASGLSPTRPLNAPEASACSVGG
jgi:hypothetical protein